MKILDSLLTVILIVTYIPLSLWGSSQHWAGKADALPFIMLAGGAVYLIAESIRLKSPWLIMCLGVLVGSLIMGPSLFDPKDRGGFFAMAIMSGIFGLAIGYLPRLFAKVSIFSLCTLLGGVALFLLSAYFWIPRFTGSMRVGLEQAMSSHLYDLWILPMAVGGTLVTVSLRELFKKR